MSEEEKAIEYIKEFKNEVFEGVGNKSIMAKNIDILLNLIEKLQKEIKHQKQQRKYWRDNFYEQQEEIEVLKEDLDKKVKALDIAMSNPDYISKDKIRAKIKELEDNMILFTNYKEKFNRYKYARDILEKTLGE